MSLTIPNYTVIQKLGHGAMADVWLAEHKIHKRQAAIKVLKPSVAMSDADIEKLFQREGEVLAWFRELNIVAIYDISRDNGLAYIIMEFLPGGNLFERMQRAPVKIGEALGIAVQVARALGAAHKLGFVHRDLKPANIMMRDETTPVLTDFGAVRLLGRSTIYGRDGGIIGTPLYMSPEQLTGGNLDGRSDLYALGVMFHELLTGRLPFPGGDFEDIAKQHLSSPIPALPHNISFLQPILARLLAKEAKDRFANAQGFINALLECYINEPNLRLQVGFSTNSEWSDQLRVLGFALDVQQKTEIRSAQDLYQQTVVRRRDEPDGLLPLAILALNAKKSAGEGSEIPRFQLAPVGKIYSPQSLRTWLIPVSIAAVFALALSVAWQLKPTPPEAAADTSENTEPQKQASVTTQNPINPPARLPTPDAVMPYRPLSNGAAPDSAPPRHRTQETAVSYATNKVNGLAMLRDSRTGVNWAQADSGTAINWKDAEQFCAGRGLRLPTVAQLQGIFDKAQKNPCGEFSCAVSPLFRLTGINLWSGERSGPLQAWYVSLYSGFRSSHSVDSSTGTSALCVAN